jgi:uncharacterized protein YeaO (DUF488 family)
MTLKIKRVYDAPAKSDGKRILVDRLWPRGLTKAAAKVDSWQKEIAPSTELRKWFAHEVEKWPEFQRRYRAELKNNSETLDELKKEMKKGNTTLVYGAKDEEHNAAVVLLKYLLGK